ARRERAGPGLEALARPPAARRGAGLGTAAGRDEQCLAMSRRLACVPVLLALLGGAPAARADSNGGASAETTSVPAPAHRTVHNGGAAYSKAAARELKRKRRHRSKPSAKANPKPKVLQ